MPPIVTLESAGTHKFDMGHLRRSGAEELIQLALEKASYLADEQWRVRVNEKQKCSGMTPPLSVTGYKPWCVYLRIKPGDNNTCHNVSLIFPNGYRAERIFAQLKGIEKGLIRNWRKAEKVTATATKEPSTTTVNGKVDHHSTVEEILEVVDEVTAAVEDRLDTNPEREFDLVKWLRDSANIRILLMEIGKLEYQKIADKKTFMKRLCEGAGINITPKQGGAMMRGIMKRGYADRVSNGKKLIGYRLTDLGRRQFSAAVPPPVPAPVKRQPVNRVKLLKDAGNVLSKINTASERLAVIARERDFLLSKIKALDEEEAELTKLIDSHEVEDLLVMLIEKTTKQTVRT